MYVLGGNDISETFGDFWRISLTDLINYADQQWAMEGTNNINQNNAIKSVVGDIRCDLNNNADDAGFSGNENNVQCENNDKKNSEKENENKVKTFIRPVWERLSRNCALDGKPIKIVFCRECYLIEFMTRVIFISVIKKNRICVIFYL